MCLFLYFSLSLASSVALPLSIHFWHFSFFFGLTDAQSLCDGAPSESPHGSCFFASAKEMVKARTSEQPNSVSGLSVTRRGE